MKKTVKRELALQKFLAKRENKKKVVGALVCGSYITGNPSKHSDIDLHIVLKKGTKWRERGNEYVDGILIEYFANPTHILTSYFVKDYADNKRLCAHMFATGKILFDKTGELKKTVSEAKKFVKKPFPKRSKITLEANKYFLRDTYDNLHEIYEGKDEAFHMVYYTTLYSIAETYTKFLQLETPKPHKIKRFLANKHDMKKYNFPELPDKHFVKLFLDAVKLHDPHKMMKKIQKLTEHVLDKMGGFNIDGWKLRSPAK